MYKIIGANTYIALKRKCCHIDEIVITGCTGSCHFNNFRCSQWWKFRQYDDFSVSVNTNILRNHPDSAYVLVCLKGDDVFKQHPATSICKHIKISVYMDYGHVSMRLQIGAVWKIASLKTQQNRRTGRVIPCKPLAGSVREHAYPANTLRNNDVAITSKRRHFDVITSKWRRFDVITTLLLRHVPRG